MRQRTFLMFRSVRSLCRQDNRILKMNQVYYLNVERTKISQAGNAKLTEGLPELGNSKALYEMFERSRGIRIPNNPTGKGWGK